MTEMHAQTRYVRRRRHRELDARQQSLLGQELVDKPKDISKIFPKRKCCCTMEVPLLINLKENVVVPWRLFLLCARRSTAPSLSLC